MGRYLLDGELLIKAAPCAFAKGKCNLGQSSLRSKRFRAVSENEKDRGRDSRFWPREK